MYDAGPGRPGDAGCPDPSGPLETVHPATPPWVGSVAKLAEATPWEPQPASLERLRAVAAPVPARLDGRAVVVDADAWPAAVSGMPYTARIPLPKSRSAGPVWLPAVGLCSLEPSADDWLTRAREGPAPHDGARIVLDPARPRRWSVTVLGGGAWTHELSARHTELLCSRTPRTTSPHSAAPAVRGERVITVP
ncbi:hypothetical protein ACWCRF_31755 [Streptomyces sp. NPDC002405]